MVAFVFVFHVSNKLLGCYAGIVASHIHTFTQSKQGMQARIISVAFGLEQAKQARHSLKLSFTMPPKKIQPAVAGVAEATDEKEKAEIDDILSPPSEQQDLDEKSAKHAKAFVAKWNKSTKTTCVGTVQLARRGSRPRQQRVQK